MGAKTIWVCLAGLLWNSSVRPRSSKADRYIPSLFCQPAAAFRYTGCDALRERCSPALQGRAGGFARDMCSSCSKGSSEESDLVGPCGVSITHSDDHGCLCSGPPWSGCTILPFKGGSQFSPLALRMWSGGMLGAAAGQSLEVGSKCLCRCCRGIAACAGLGVSEASSSHQVIGSIWKLFVHFVVASRCIGGPSGPSVAGAERGCALWTTFSSSHQIHRSVLMQCGLDMTVAEL